MNYRKKILTCDLLILIYILHQQDKVPIRIQSKKSCLWGFFFIYKNLVHGPFDFSACFSLPIQWYWKWFEFKYSVITTKLFVRNSDKECVKHQILCQIKPREIQIAQHQFNSKTFYTKQFTSSIVTETSQVLDLSLFVSVSTPFLRASSRAPDTVTMHRRYSLQQFLTATAGCACTPWYECEKPYSR